MYFSSKNREKSPFSFKGVTLWGTAKEIVILVEGFDEGALFEGGPGKGAVVEGDSV